MCQSSNVCGVYYIPYARVHWQVGGWLQICPSTKHQLIPTELLQLLIRNQNLPSVQLDVWTTNVEGADTVSGQRHIIPLGPLVSTEQVPVCSVACY